MLPYCLNKQAMFGSMHPRRKCIQCVVSLKRHFLHNDDIPGINLWNDIVHHDAAVVDFAALERCKGALNRINPCKLSGKGRVQIDDASGKQIQKGRTKNVHPAC